MHTDLVVNYQSHRSVCEEVEKKEKLSKGAWQHSGPQLQAPLFKPYCPNLLTSPTLLAKGTFTLSFYQYDELMVCF